MRAFQSLFILFSETLDTWLHLQGMLCVEIAAVVAIRHGMFGVQVGAITAAISVLFPAQVEQKLALLLLTIADVCCWYLQRGGLS